MAEVFHRAQISKQNGGCVFIVVDALTTMPNFIMKNMALNQL
jgi:hypothetical protein